MIYKIEKDVDVKETNEGLKANEIFNKCTDRELRYIFLLYDIESPYIKMRFEDRKTKAALDAGYRMEKGGKRFDKNARQVLDGKSRRVNEAIKEFRTIQLASNTNYAVISALTAQIDRTVSFIEGASTDNVKEMLDINRLASGLEGLIQTKVNIERILQVEDIQDLEEDDETLTNLSTLDQVNTEQN